MTVATPDVLLRVLQNPAALPTLSVPEWDLLIRIARRNRLLARIGYLIDHLDIAEKCPQKALDNIVGARVYVDHFQFLVNRELQEVSNALTGIDAPILLLKGAAYLLARLPPTHGRLLSDLDILVKQDDLPMIEERLKNRGWKSKITNEYDQRYYREWMHEIPPLTHKNRSVEVDIHHNLLPLTGRLRVDARILWQQARRIPDTEVFTLAATDMVLHSAAHLFFSDELRGGLRDLLDISELCKYFANSEEDFYPRLLARSQALNLSRPLYYALYCAKLMLRTPLPEEMLDRANFDLPGIVGRQVMQNLIIRSLTPKNPVKGGAPVSEWLLYVRSHWVRMPPGMLAGHLTRKAFRRHQQRSR